MGDGHRQRAEETLASLRAQLDTQAQELARVKAELEERTLQRDCADCDVLNYERQSAALRTAALALVEKLNNGVLNAAVAAVVAKGDLSELSALRALLPKEGEKPTIDLGTPKGIGQPLRIPETRKDSPR